MSAYLMVSQHSEELNEAEAANIDLAKPGIKKPSGWDEGKGWKNILNNLRLLIQPLCCFNLLKPWLFAALLTISTFRSSPSGMTLKDIESQRPIISGQRTN